MLSILTVRKLSLQLARDDGVPYFGLCSCEKRPHECFFWSDVLNAIKSKYGIDIVRSPFNFRVSDIGREEDFGIRSFRHWLLRKYCRLWRTLGYESESLFIQKASFFSLFPRRWALNRLFVVDAIRHITGAKTVIDSSKDPISMVDLYKLQQGNMKVIFITRDVRGNVWSYAKNGMPISIAAKNWNKVNSRIRKCLGQIAKSDWTQLKYEDLCADTVKVTGELWEFLGHENFNFKENLQTRQWHTIGGNKIRKKSLTNIMEDLSWHQHISIRDLELINRIAGREASTLGY